MVKKNYIGMTFELDGKKFEVVPESVNAKNGCEGCYFYNPDDPAEHCTRRDESDTIIKQQLWTQLESKFRRVVDVELCRVEFGILKEIFTETIIEY